MTKYILKRLLMMLATMVMITLVTFTFMHIVPGGPFAQEKQIPASVQAALEEKYHL